MKPYKRILISIVAIVLSSCSSATNLAEQSSIPMPDVGADIQKGKYLEIMAPEGWNKFKTNDHIVLAIRNISENQITSGPDFGARIFIRIDKEWIEVKNKAGYEYQLFRLDPSDNWYPEAMVSTGVFPELPDYSVPYDIRIVVVGDLIENGKKSKKVGSYIDVTLKP